MTSEVLKAARSVASWLWQVIKFAWWKRCYTVIIVLVIVAGVEFGFIMYYHRERNEWQMTAVVSYSVALDRTGDYNAERQVTRNLADAVNRNSRLIKAVVAHIRYQDSEGVHYLLSPADLAYIESGAPPMSDDGAIPE